MLDDRARLERSRSRSQEIARGWHASAPYRMLDAAFGAAADGDVEQIASIAARVLGDTAWVGALLAPLIAALHDDPLFEPPFRLARDPLRTSAILYDGAAASVVATVLSADALSRLPTPATIALSGRLSLVRYERAGGARLRCWHAPAPREDLSSDATPPARPVAPVALEDGMVRRLDGREHGFLLADARRDMAYLTVAIRAGTAPLAREYRIDDGAFVRAAALSDDDSRTRMLLTLLRLGGRADASHVFAAATRSDAFFVRWSAMREWLALDAAAALPRLAAMAADDPNGEVRAAAAGTLTQVEAARACHA